jgi:glycerophosphoryl diester phosphodiesterase
MRPGSSVRYHPIQAVCTIVPASHGCHTAWSWHHRAVESLLHPPISFAHRGARADAPENTLEAFTLARRLGASGLESDVWMTSDGQAVLDHDGVLRHGLRRRPIGEVARRQLPAHVPTLEDLYATCGTQFELSLDVKDPTAAPAVIAVAQAAGALGRLWLCHPSWRVAASWRALSGNVRLVDSTRLARMADGPERRAAELADAGVDAVNLHHSDWTLGLVTLFHRFSRVAFGWDAQHAHVLARLLGMGIDGVFCDHVDRMVAAVAQSQR